MKLRTELELGGKTATGFEVPESVVEALGGGNRPKVVVTVNGYRFRTSIARMGDRFMIPVSADRRAAAGVAAGDALDVAVELDTAPREIEVPDDLSAALAAEPAAAEFWDTLSYSKKRWHVLQITGAKTTETRARRIAKSIDLLRGPCPLTWHPGASTTSERQNHAIHLRSSDARAQWLSTARAGRRHRRTRRGGGPIRCARGHGRPPPRRYRHQGERH